MHLFILEVCRYNQNSTTPTIIGQEIDDDEVKKRKEAEVIDTGIFFQREMGRDVHNLRTHYIRMERAIKRKNTAPQAISSARNSLASPTSLAHITKSSSDLRPKSACRTVARFGGGDGSQKCSPRQPSKPRFGALHREVVSDLRAFQSLFFT